MEAVVGAALEFHCIPLRGVVKRNYIQLLKYGVEASVLYLSISISCHFILLLHDINLTAAVTLQIN